MKPNVLAVLMTQALAFFSFVAAASDIKDSISFGDLASEAEHDFSGERSEKIAGGFGEAARRLLAPAAGGWEGGRMAFTLKVDPAKPNYATVKLWGSDTTRDLLLLFCEGKQIGYRHLGDVDILDIGGEGPAFSGRFFYTTTPLPLEMTRGKSQLHFEIRSLGPIWGYGQSFEQYQKPMTEATRGIYRLYTHTESCFVPPPGEKRGSAPANPPMRSEPGEEVLENIRSRVNGELKKLIESPKPLNQMQMQFVARAYHVKWTPAFHNAKALAQVLRSLDAIFAADRRNPRLAEAEPSTWNPDWFGLGPSGDVLRLLAEEIKPVLDVVIEDGNGGKVPRRAAYSEMLVACRDWHREHRRLYTNQSMINDLYGIYLANRGIEVADPARALPESEARRYLYESVGLAPWRDSDAGGGAAAETERRNWGVGTNYWELTAKGLTKELGYVGYYGEVLDWVTAIYEATRPTLEQPGDERIRDQLVFVGHARAVFRYAALDNEGFRAMRIEAVVGWRDAGHYPGDVAYAERVSWDGSPLGYTAATLDPHAIGYVQQMFADNQFFALMKDHSRQTSLRVTAGLLAVPDQYDLLRAQAPQPYRLPMTPDQPDFVFSDEEDGVIALKHGQDILYASLYWRARNAVNFLARVHYTTPTVDRLAVAREEVEFSASGMFFTRPDHINFGFANGGPNYPNAPHSAHAGEKLPIAKLPAGIKFRPGDESVYAGKGDFYTLRYGDYLIAMNMTTNRTFELRLPTGVGEGKQLVSGKSVKGDAPLNVGPRSTVVLWWGGSRNEAAGDCSNVDAVRRASVGCQRGI